MAKTIVTGCKRVARPSTSGEKTWASSGPLRRWLERDPVMLVYQGEVIPEHIRREGVSLADLEAAVREHGVSDLTRVETAVLEMDGTISVIPKAPAQTKRLRKVRSSRNR